MLFWCFPGAFFGGFLVLLVLSCCLVLFGAFLVLEGMVCVCLCFPFLKPMRSL